MAGGRMDSVVTGAVSKPARGSPILLEDSNRVRGMKVGQTGSLRGGWLPPLSPANATVGRLPNRPRLTKLPATSLRTAPFNYLGSP